VIGDLQQVLDGAALRDVGDEVGVHGGAWDTGAVEGDGEGHDGVWGRGLRGIVALESAWGLTVVGGRMRARIARSP
jgi:hypothetical protein